MALPRFYCPEKITAGQTAHLPVSAAHHALRALRLGRGDKLILFNGFGGEFQAVIAGTGKTGVAVVIEKYLNVERESPLVITLGQAVSVSEKMDWIVQKGVEMGVCRFQPLVTKLSMVRLSGERAERRAKHWQQIAVSACEQCGRNRIPQVLPLLPLSSWLGAQISERKNLSEGVPTDSCFILSPVAKKGLRDFAGSARAALALLVGPEGGFTPEEEAAAVVAGFTPLRLGERILRTESAALAAVAAMQTLWGDY